MTDTQGDPSSPEQPAEPLAGAPPGLARRAARFRHPMCHPWPMARTTEYLGLCLTCRMYVRTTNGRRVDGPVLDHDGSRHRHPGEWTVSWNCPIPYLPSPRIWPILPRVAVGLFLFAVACGVVAVVLPS